LNITNGRRVAYITAAAFTIMGLVVATPILAQSPPQPSISGTIHHYTADLDGSGPWQIVGPWTLTLNTATGTVDLVASLSKLRSDNPSRQAHTHHVRMIAGQVSPIANGWRISGTAAITSGGVLAPFSGSLVDIDVTGGPAVAFANIKVGFSGAAAGHFGTEPLHGVVHLTP
jgi:hypothetical protein